MKAVLSFVVRAWVGIRTWVCRGQDFPFPPSQAQDVGGNEKLLVCLPQRLLRKVPPWELSKRQFNPLGPPSPTRRCQLWVQ